MRRRALAAVVSATAVIAAATYVALDETHPGSSANTKPTYPVATVAPTPASSAAKAVSYTIKPANTASSFRTTLGSGSSKGESYDVVFKRGDLTSFKPNLTSVALPIPSSGWGNGNGAPLGRTCKFDHKTARAYPFSVSVTNATTDLYPVFVHFDAHGVNGAKLWELPAKRVQMEFADSGGNIECYDITRSGSFRMPASPKRPTTMTGWMIMEGEGQAKGIQLSVTTVTPFSGVATNHVTKLTGEFAPNRVGTITGRGQVVNGGTLPLMPN